MTCTMLLTLTLAITFGCRLTNGALIAFSARNLPSMDIANGAPDPYINVYYAPTATSQYEYYGRTSVISDNRNPEWPEAFEFQFIGGSSLTGISLTKSIDRYAWHRFKFDMYDADSPDSDDYMGFVEILFADIVNTIGGIVYMDLIGGKPGGGYVMIKRVQAAAAATGSNVKTMIKH